MQTRESLKLAESWTSTVEELQHHVAQTCGRKHAFITSSGTAAIYFVLRALRIEGQVIMPAIVCPTVYYSVRTAGAVPVLADISLRDFNIDPQSVSRLLSPKVEAVISVNLFGYPAMTEEIAQLIGSTSFVLIEDAAQSIGGARHGRPLGGWGDVSIVSFGDSKILKAGGGGAILVDDDAIADAVRSELAAVQSDNALLAEAKRGLSEYVVDHFMDQYEKTRTRWADLLIERARFVFRWLFSGQMRKEHMVRALHRLNELPEVVTRRAANANVYRTRLVHPDVAHPAYEEGQGVVWRYSVLVRDQDQQERVLNTINEQEIVASRHYPPLHWQFPDCARATDLTASEQIGNRIVNLPVSPDMPQSTIDSLCVLFSRGLAQAAQDRWV